MCSVYSQPVGRGFRWLGKSMSTQPPTLFLGEFPFPWKILLSLFLILKFSMFFFFEKQNPSKKILQWIAKLIGSDYRSVWNNLCNTFLIKRTTLSCISSPIWIAVKINEKLEKLLYSVRIYHTIPPYIKMYALVWLSWLTLPFIDEDRTNSLYHPTKRMQDIVSWIMNSILLLLVLFYMKILSKKVSIIEWYINFKRIITMWRVNDYVLLTVTYNRRQEKCYPQRCQIVRKMQLTAALCNEIWQQ